jgi:hypothetical protein
MGGFAMQDPATVPAAVKHSAPKRQLMHWLKRLSSNGYVARNCLHLISAAMALGCNFVANVDLRFVASSMALFMV